MRSPNRPGRRLTAVSSRRIENAQSFRGRAARGCGGGRDRRVAGPRDDVDAVYIATPTVAKEEIALAAIAAGKHVLVDKPFSTLRPSRA